MSAAAVMRTATLAAVMALWAGAHGRAQDASIEYAVKATYLYKLGPLVEWPAAAFASDAGSFQVCIVGTDPFGEILDRALAGQTIAGRPIAIARQTMAERNSGCHIMYVTGSTRQSVAQALEIVRGDPVMTVTEEGAAPGIIHFVISDNRVRFEIDDFAAAENGLKISSKVLSLAVRVKRRA